MQITKQKTTITLTLSSAAWHDALQALRTDGRIDAHVDVVATDVRPSLRQCPSGGTVILTATSDGLIVR